MIGREICRLYTDTALYLDKLIYGGTSFMKKDNHVQKPFAIYGKSCLLKRILSVPKAHTVTKATQRR